MNDSEIEGLINRFGPIMEDCLKIRTICEDLGHCWEKSTLQVEIHHVAMSAAVDIETTLDARQDIHAAALRTMRNTEAREAGERELVNELLEHPDRPPEELDGWRQQKATEAFAVGNRLDALDQHLARRGGMRGFLATQLDQSERLYSDPAFRQSEIRFYLEEVAPRLSQYTRADIKRVFP